ncbi:MAG TPA: metallophosphoesterase [Thermomicrobiales bacterium]|nr:metallophosphoesterase [Thermomicrobiales bacterium]
MATVEEQRTTEARGDPLLVFLSDLHLAADPEKRDFFAQAELTALFDELLARPEPVDLIIAGDFFDLLQLTGADRATVLRLALERPENAGFLERLRRITATPGNRTVYLIGNHDAEMGWNESLRRYLLDTGLVGEISLAYAHTYGDGRGDGCLVYCEHGNDYDGLNTVGDYTNPAVSPPGAHIVTDLVNYLEPLGRHASSDAPTSIADIDNIHPLGMVPWWFISNYFYRQVRRVVKYVLAPGLLLYLIFHLLPIYVLLDRYGTSLLARGIRSLPDFEVVLSFLVIAFDSSLLLIFFVWLLIRYDFGRTRRRYGLQDPDDIFRRGARHYRRTCEGLVRGALLPAHWPRDEPWTGADLFVYGHTHEQALTEIDVDGRPRAFANTGTWTRKVVRIRTHLKLPPVFVPTYELTYLLVRRVGAAVRVELWERPKVLTYRLPWTERLATLGRRRPGPRGDDLAPRVLAATEIPFRRGVAAPLPAGREAREQSKS